MKKTTTGIEKIEATMDSPTTENACTIPDSSLGSDLELSRKIQQAMIPKSLPGTQGIEIASLFLPCETLGGDLYDVIQISEDLIAFFIFDVAAHGVTSVLISSLAKVSFSNNIRTITSPQVILERVNDDLIENISDNFYITAFVAFLDLHSNKLTFCNAGHTYPIVYKKKEKKIIPLKTSGIFLGVYKRATFENRGIYLFPEDWFFLFSDGFYSLFSNENELVGRKQLEASILNEDYKSPTELIDNYMHRYNVMFADKKQTDDITAVVVEILTQSRRDQIKKDLGFSEEIPVYLQFISYYEEIDKVSAKILRDMDETGYSDESIRKMKLTITELLANAIGHGNKDDHSKKVTMGYVVETTIVTIAIMDEGKGFNPLRIPDPTLPQNLIKDHGRGLYIVRNYVDEIDFNRKGNRILIRKYRFSGKRNGSI